MQCSCLEDVRTRLRDHIADEIGAPVQSIECQNAGFTLGKTLNAAIFLNFNIKADAPGYRAKNGKAMRVHVSHCPFCGKSARPEAEAA